MTSENVDWRCKQIEEMREQSDSLRGESLVFSQEADQIEARINELEREQQEEEAKDNVAKLAVLFSESQERYSDVFSTHLRSFESCTEDEFWTISGRLGSKIKYWLDGLGRCNPVKRAANNVFWDMLDMANWSMECWEQCARFAVTYQEFAHKLYQHCHEMKGIEKGDDGYSDWTDSLPLAGKSVVVGILFDDIATYKQVEAALAKHRPELKDFIQNGENYVRRTLEETLREFFVTVVKQNGGKTDEE